MNSAAPAPAGGRPGARVRVSVPATTANLGPGFDCLGLALDWFNTIEAELLPAGAGVVVEVEGEGSPDLPRDATNLAYRALALVWQDRGLPPPAVRLRLENTIPLASGLGSSAAACAGGLVAGWHLLPPEVREAEPDPLACLLRLGHGLEGHPDNVAPALLGGLTVAAVAEGEGGAVAGEEGGAVAGEKAGGGRGRRAVVAHRLPPPAGLGLVVAVPPARLATAAARRVLPEAVPRAAAVFNVQRIALLLAALLTGDFRHLPLALEDALHEPYRWPLVPGWQEAAARARAAGAYGVVLSGAGPSLLAITPAGREAEVRQAWEELYGEDPGRGQVRVVGVAREGAWARVSNTAGAGAPGRG